MPQDFSTIDWIKDRRRDKIAKSRNLIGHSYYRVLFDSVRGYLLIVLIGICIGLVASQINSLSAWLTDVKSGYCINAWYLSKRLCCLSHQKLNECVEWTDWSFAIFNVSNLYIVRWISYCILSVIINNFKRITF